MTSTEVSIKADWKSHSLGTSPRNPFKIVTLLNTRAVGDTILAHVFCASVKRLFDHSSMTIFHRNDREYKLDLLHMNTHKDQFIFAKPSFPGVTVDSFQGTNDLRAVGLPIPDYIVQADYWMKSGSNRPNLILSPTGMPEDMLGGFEHPAFLEIPDDRVEGLEAEIQGHGLLPDRWFCVLNYREPGYQHRPPRPNKDLDPKPFMELVKYITETLGGQVVRVGHPNMTPFPARPGFIDLAKVENNFMLHAFAISRARFLVGSLSGISHLGSAVNTPTIITNCVQTPYFPGCWRDHDIVLYANLFDPSGRRVPIAEQWERNFVGSAVLVDLVKNHGYSMAQNTIGELERVVDALMESTIDCQSWRSPSRRSEPAARPNRFEFPIRPRIRPRILEFPEVARR